MVIVTLLVKNKENTKSYELMGRNNYTISTDRGIELPSREITGN